MLLSNAFGHRWRRGICVLPLICCPACVYVCASKHLTSIYGESPTTIHADMIMCVPLCVWGVYLSAHLQLVCVCSMCVWVWSRGRQAHSITLSFICHGRTADKHTHRYAAERLTSALHLGVFCCVRWRPCDVYVCLSLRQAPSPPLRAWSGKWVNCCYPGRPGIFFPSGFGITLFALEEINRLGFVLGTPMQ